MFLKNFATLFIALSLMLNPLASLMPLDFSTAQAKTAEKKKSSAEKKTKKKSAKKQKSKKQKAKKAAKKSKSQQRSHTKSNNTPANGFDIRPDADAPAMPANDPLDDAAAELPEAKDTL